MAVTARTGCAHHARSRTPITPTAPLALPSPFESSSPPIAAADYRAGRRQHNAPLNIWWRARVYAAWNTTFAAHTPQTLAPHM